MRQFEPVQEGYRCFTGHVLTAGQADAINRANAKAAQNPTEENLNGAHNLFNSIAMTGKG